MRYRESMMLKPLTVSQLIKLLQQCPPGLPVVHEGCDCDGDAFSVELSKDRVYITRSDFKDLDEYGKLIVATED